jgi:hypothetical protein
MSSELENMRKEDLAIGSTVLSRHARNTEGNSGNSNSGCLPMGFELGT